MAVDKLKSFLSLPSAKATDTISVKTVLRCSVDGDMRKERICSLVVAHEPAAMMLSKTLIDVGEKTRLEPSATVSMTCFANLTTTSFCFFFFLNTVVLFLHVLFYSFLFQARKCR